MDLRHRHLVGTSEAIRLVAAEVECAARTDAKVLLTGESGVGKEVVANLIHHESRRRAAPFVAINCAGVPDSLLESELFGHLRGSFTDAHRDKKGWLEQANGGTVFLDEVGEMTMRMQSVLLRFLECGEIQRVGADRVQARIDVRIIAATNRSLVTQVAEGKFRDDLYYRLNVIHIPIPPLRERMTDLPVLLNYFMETASAKHHVRLPVLADATMAHLMAYPWPGNVRELRNVVERLVIRAREGAVPPTDLPKEILLHGAVLPKSIVTERTAGAGLYERMTVEGESFWSAVYEPFMARDLTRDDLRAVVCRGLEQTRGRYKLLLEVFNVAPGDYKRLLGFLRKYECHMPFQKFRSVSVSSASMKAHRRVENETPMAAAR